MLQELGKKAGVKNTGKMFDIVVKNKNKTPKIERKNKKQDQPTKQTKLEGCISCLSHCCGKMSTDHGGREGLFRDTV